MKNSLVNKSVLNVIKNNILFFICLLFIIISVVIISLIPPQLLRIIMDKHLVIKNSNGLLNMAFLYLIVLLFIGLFDVLKAAMLTILGQKTTKEIRINMIYKLEKITTLYFSCNNSGTIVSRFTNDVDTISSLFTDGIISMIIDCFKIIGIIISIWLFSTELAVMTLIIIPIIYIITRTFRKIMLNAQIKNRILVGKVNNHISESIKNVTMIKSYSKENYMENRYKDYLLENYQTVDRVNYLDSIYSPIIMLIRAIVISAIILLSSKQFNLMGISLGMVAASIELVSNLFSPIENLGMELQSIQSSISGIHRVNEFYLEKEDDEKNPQCTYDNIIKNRKNISINFNNLNFHYTEGTEILKNFTLSINALEIITFVGRTGIGKSTLFKLIMGLLKPCDGSITINDVDVYTIPNREKRKLFGYVDQNFSFIRGTVANQVSLQNPNISQTQIEETMKFVGLHEYICSLENGYNTMINKNSVFSQGQKQLLAIGRAIVTDPPILLLDEITANLDSLTEEKIISVLQKSSSSRTILSISHRLSSILACNRIISLEKFNEN